MHHSGLNRKEMDMQEIGQAEAMSKTLERFLDEFMLIEYNGHDHIVARKHYAEVFAVLVPKYYLPTPSSTNCPE